MGYTFSPLPSISLHHRNFSNQIVFQSRKPNPQTTTHIPSQESAFSKKTNNLQHNNNKSNLSQSIWVNPKYSKASKFSHKTYDSRFPFLRRVAKSLNSSSPLENGVVFNILNTNFENNLVEQDGVFILNSISNPLTARIVLEYFLTRCSLSFKIVLYNVALKVFRNFKDFDSAEKLFDEMLERGVKPDIVTFSTIIGCARMCFQPGKAVEWFERMIEFGIEPDDAIFAVMIDAYGRIGNVDMALALYERARIENWCIGAVTFTTVIRINGTIGNFDECLSVFREMKAYGIEPSLGCYNTLLDAIARGKLGLEIKSIHREIMRSGLQPGWATYAALLRAYCKARCGDDALIVYKDMKAKGMVLNNVLYNTLFSMCADTGFVDEALNIFEDMKRCKDCIPDSRTFSSMITILSKYGRHSQAEAILKEMLEAGFKHDIFVLTKLIEGYAKSNLTDDVVRTLDTIMELDITPDERSCRCLLKVIIETPEEELGKVTRCIKKANPKLGNVVKTVVECDDGVDETLKSEASQVLAHVGSDVRNTYCNCLIDLCINLEKPKKESYFRTLL